MTWMFFYLTIQPSYYSWAFSFFWRISSFIRRALSIMGFHDLRAKLEPQPQWVFTASHETIHLFPDRVIRISEKKSTSELRVWKVILFWFLIFLSIPSAIHSSTWTFSPAHPRAMRKQETSVMPRVCQSKRVFLSKIIIDSIIRAILLPW